MILLEYELLTNRMLSSDGVYAKIVIIIGVNRALKRLMTKLKCTVINRTVLSIGGLNKLSL